ncbi:MAG: AbrB/MazE/SpoVT family DNA-binding domain-containing protein [Halanaerobiales bacterium]|nr:AbrB/MazE/SpoVT family DNA-binding domain-containing protein [Halanaerobiales bacterium]
MKYSNTLTLTKADDRGRFYIKSHILDRLNIKSNDQFEVWVYLDDKEILLKPYLQG